VLEPYGQLPSNPRQSKMSGIIVFIFSTLVGRPSHRHCYNERIISIQKHQQKKNQYCQATVSALLQDGNVLGGRCQIVVRQIEAREWLAIKEIAERDYN
jgi:hypothetical protein